MKLERINKNERFNMGSQRKSVSYAKYNNFHKLFNGQNDASKDGLIEILNNQKNNEIKQTLVNQNKMAFNDQKLNDLNNIQMNRLYIRSKSKESEDLKKFEKESFCNINFNIFEFYCFWKLTKKKNQIELFKLAFKFFKSQMDIINFFNIIILTQIMLTQQSEKKHNMLSQTIELSMK